MRIESIIKRATGSSVTLGDKTYRFVPSENHICEVEDKSHAERLLSIKEGFREAVPVAAKNEVAPVVVGALSDGKAPGDSTIVPPVVAPVVAQPPVAKTKVRRASSKGAKAA